MKDARSASLMGLHAASVPSPNMTYGLPSFTSSTCGTSGERITQDCLHFARYFVGTEEFEDEALPTWPARDLKNAVGRTML